jgi:putative tryptophan/tyrosine transport system substrate-binding protein
MRRREFIALIGGAALARPVRALAERDARLPLVAMLHPGTEQFFKPRAEAIRDGLKDEGLLEGRHYAVEIRVAAGNFSRLPELVRELDALKPRVFVAGANAVMVVRSLLPDRPLVFTAFAADPIAYGLVQNYTRPGGTATGNVMNAVGGEESLTAKRLGFFRELVPDIKRLGMIGGVVEGQIAGPGGLSWQEQAALRKLSTQLGFGFEYYEIKTLDDLEAVFSKALGDGVGAFYISGDPLLGNNMARVMPHVAAAGKPTLGVYPEWGRAGLLLTYSTDPIDGYRRAGVYAAKIIQGAKPGDLPIEQAGKFTLVINLKTARRLGINVPPNLLTLADELIE